MIDKVKGSVLGWLVIIVIIGIGWSVTQYITKVASRAPGVH